MGAGSFLYGGRNLAALKEADGNKAPGPNGFPFKFMQTFWDVIKRDLLGLFHSFHEYAEFDYHFSESFISHIPKVKIQLH